MKTVLAINNQFPTEASKKYGLISAVPYYRQVMPGKYLDGFEFHHLGHKLVNLEPTTAESTIGNLVKEHDIVFSKHLDNPTGIYMLLGACDFYKRPLIIDFDDDIFATDGKEHNLYVYPENSDAKHYVETLIREATAITVSSRSLFDVYYPLNKHVYVCPNAVDLSDWTVRRKHYDRPTIGWPASTGHIVDHPVFEPVMERLARERPDVVFSMVGHYMPEQLKFLPRKNWELKPGITWWSGNPEDPRTYPGVLADLGADIGVAPLLDSRYNTSRSLTKWFEYTMTDTPMVASEYGPYLELEDGQDAYLVQTVEGWVKALTNLLDNPNDRERIVANARARIAREYTIQHTIPAWSTVFKSFPAFR